MHTRIVGILVIAIAFLAAAPQSQAAENFLKGSYFEIRAGSNFFEDADNGAGGSGPFAGETDFDTGFTAGVAVGYGFSDRQRFGSGLWNNLRIEAELGYDESDIENDSSNAELSVQKYMFNVYYDFDTGTNWRPFVGGGVGAADIEADGVSLVDDDDTVFAYQVRAGVAYQFTPTISGTLGYRFFDTEDPEFRSASGTQFDTETRSHAVEVGIRIRF